MPSIVGTAPGLLSLPQRDNLESPLKRWVAQEASPKESSSLSTGPTLVHFTTFQISLLASLTIHLLLYKFLSPFHQEGPLGALQMMQSETALDFGDFLGYKAFPT